MAMAAQHQHAQQLAQAQAAAAAAAQAQAVAAAQAQAAAAAAAVAAATSHRSQAQQNNSNSHHQSMNQVYSYFTTTDSQGNPVTTPVNMSSESLKGSNLPTSIRELATFSHGEVVCAVTISEASKRVYTVSRVCSNNEIVLDENYLYSGR